MNIAIIGAGNIGGALAEGWAKKGHRIFLGVKDPLAFKADRLLNQYDNITAHPVPEAAAAAHLVVVSVPAKAVVEVAHQLGTLPDKAIIDTTNGPVGSPEYPHAVAALQAITGCPHVIICFNTSGYENLLDPTYDGHSIDMFMAGSSTEAKATARRLALELGFAECYDLGDDAKIPLVEQLAFVWITLAFGTKLGRNFAIKILKR